MKGIDATLPFFGPESLRLFGLNNFAVDERTRWQEQFLLLHHAAIKPPNIHRLLECRPQELWVTSLKDVMTMVRLALSA